MKHLAIHLKLLGMAAFWGASWPMGRMLGQALPPLTGGMLRFLTAAILLLGWLFARYRLRTLAVLSRKQWIGAGGGIRRIWFYRIVYAGFAADSCFKGNGVGHIQSCIDDVFCGFVVW